MMTTWIRRYRSAAGHADRLQGLVLLGLRLWLFKVFFAAGWLKLASWDTTLALFEDLYHVPLLPPHVAAVAGTFGETVFPLMLLAGAGTRFFAAGLFVVNLVAVISYPDLTELTRQFHYYWGGMILVLLAFGAGPLSLEGLCTRRVKA